MIRGNSSPTSVPGASAVFHVGDFFSSRAANTSPRSLKPFTSVAEQIALLKARGLVVADESKARDVLRRIGYYRFSGYAHSLKGLHAASHVHPGPAAGPDTFRPGATFELILALDEFDKALRSLVLRGLETIEIAVRAAVVARLGRIDAEGHRNPRLLDGRFTSATDRVIGSPHEEWLKRFDALCARSKEEFVEHHRRHYAGKLPVWAAVEVLDFGLLSRLVAGLQQRDRKALSAHFNVGHPGVLSSWMHMFNVTRNRAAHHVRLWNRPNAKIPLLPSLTACPDLAFLHGDLNARTRLFGTLCCMRSMIRTIAPPSTWHVELNELVASFPAAPTLSIVAAGFPAQWQDLPLWAV